MILSRRQRLLGALVLAAGAAASIATSQVAWNLEDSAPLDPVILDESLPSVAYAVHVEYTGTVANPEGNISLALTVEKEPAMVGTPSLHVTITDDATQQIVGEQDWVYDPSVTDPQGPWLSATAWIGCTAGCSQDFTVVIERTDPITDAPWPQARISGTFDAYLAEYGNGNEPEGVSMGLEVTPL